MIIDANMYWFPEKVFEKEEEASKFLAEIPQAYGINGRMEENENGLKQIIIEKPTGYQNLNYIQKEYLLKTQLNDLDLAGVDKAILKLPGCHEWMSLETCKEFNDGMYAYSIESNHRLIPLACVPPYGTKENLLEVERCIKQLGFKGVQLCAHYGNYYLDDDIFATFFERLNELNLTVYVHHTPLPVQHDALLDYNNLRRSYGRCVDQTTAIGRELFSGFFDKYPNLKFVHSMLGGGFFAIADMLLPKPNNNNDSVKRFDNQVENVRKRFKENIFFETSHAQPWGKYQLECAINVLGADHIIFGTSYPVRKEWLLEGADYIKTLNVSDEDKDLILYKNALRIYGIES